MKINKQIRNDKEVSIIYGENNLINVKVTSFNHNNLFGFHKINNVKAA